jgi:hypothetical protein
VIFYENPWSGWNFAGVCIENKVNGQLSSSQARDIYRRLYRAHPRWPSNCWLADNTRSKSVSFQERRQLVVGGYKIGAFVQYRLVDKAGPNDCYNQEITVAISTA